jgi:hypothetical protein
MLAQEVARLDHELRRSRNGAARSNGAEAGDESRAASESAP